MSNEYDDKKYISCKGCGCELEADWRKCPYCKAINESAPKGSSKKSLVIIISVLCIIAVVTLILFIFARPSALLNPDKIKVYSVLNGSGNAVIGKRAEITVSKDSIKALPPEEFNAFMENEIAGSAYNWFTIDFNDGTGIIFVGCDITQPMYGKIGDEGMLKESIGYIYRHKADGTVSFEYKPVS